VYAHSPIFHLQSTNRNLATFLNQKKNKKSQKQRTLSRIVPRTPTDIVLSAVYSTVSLMSAYTDY